ncbi:aspartyl protease family protein 1-like isoform X1 [Malania oleifera]|nr:aspartyl protease family protein 1-like isoform X1 [Malania oleifera]
MYHRFSDPVREILPADGLPKFGTLEYYAAMAHRDLIFHGRRLAGDGHPTPLIFAGGNVTYRSSLLGHLHYANISVGTPSLSFLVALDTGSGLLWLPCDCTSCTRSLKTSIGNVISFNIYSPSASSTSVNVPCSSSFCAQQKQCSTARDTCPYQVSYLSNGTSSTGTLVEDVLHLTSYDQSKAVDALIPFGCGRVQTGSFLEGGAPNGLFGLGLDNISVPSILAKEGLTANSFSMCFGSDGIGRIIFGDEGSSDQRETPFNFHDLYPTYNVGITQVDVGGNITRTSFSAIFDSGTSFSYLNDPVYTYVTDSFDSQAQEKRHQLDSNIPFDYCYDLDTSIVDFRAPSLILTMEGGKQFNVTQPTVLVSLNGRYLYCLGVIKSGDVNIIGQNFMTGYRIVFDREKMVLGWIESNCYDTEDFDTLPISPRASAEAPSIAPPAAVVDPEAAAGAGNGSHISEAYPDNHSPLFNIFTCAFMLVFLSCLAI